MDLKQLLEAMNAAKAAWDADQKNMALKAVFEAAEIAYNEAKAAAEADPEHDPNSPEEDESKWDDKTKALIKKLRGEAAKHRTKAKELGSKVTAEQERTKAILKAAGIESEEEKPEEKVKALTNTTNELAFRNAILESAVNHGIPASGLKYYQFLVSEATSELEEGEELSEEKMTEIVAEAKKMGGGKSANTSVGGKGKDGKPLNPKPGDAGEITLDQFCSMSITEKSNLYLKSKEVYEALYAQAKAKKRLLG